jgi:hypothetical protein
MAAARRPSSAGVQRRSGVSGMGLPSVPGRGWGRMGPVRDTDGLFCDTSGRIWGTSGLPLWRTEGAPRSLPGTPTIGEGTNGPVRVDRAGGDH